jgi:hypothetical protein
MLIGGTSSVGKSTVAAALAGRLGWELVSTDRLARHPGRPWSTDPVAAPVPEHVVRHYRTLQVDELTAEQLRHYERLWPRVAELVRARVAEPTAPGLVLEGSGVLPEGVVALGSDAVAAVWLTARAELITARIRAMSGPESSQVLVDAFIGRTLGYERAVLATVRRLGLPVVAVHPAESVDALADRCLALAAPPERTRP